jgi:hypothetical protein
VAKRGTELDWMQKDLEYLKKTKHTLLTKLDAIEDMEVKTQHEIGQLKIQDKYIGICESNQKELSQKEVELN